MIYLVKGDIGSQIKATLRRDDDGSPVDLTGAVVLLKVRKAGSNVTLFEVTADTSSPILLTQGVAIFSFSGPNLDRDAGRYEAEIQATFPDANIETVYEFVDIILRADFEPL
jgi:hypothetical protein